jgi:hypothetical protein
VELNRRGPVPTLDLVCPDFVWEIIALTASACFAQNGDTMNGA